MIRHKAFLWTASAVVMALAAPDVSLTSAQTLEWIRQFGTSERDGAYGVSADPLGNVFVSGVTWGSLGGTAAGQWDAFFAKYDQHGTELWTRQLGIAGGESAWGISADGLGNVYVQGDTSGSLFGPFAGSFDIWLAKYDGNGNQLWSRQLGTSGSDEYGQVEANPLGGAYVSGRTQGSLGGPNGGPLGTADQFLASYSADGELLWSRQLSSPSNDNYSRLSADNLGNVYIAGNTRDNLFGPNAGEADAYLAKYGSDGTLLWGRQFGTSAKELGHGGVATDAFGNVFMLGDTGGSLGGPSAGDQDIFLTKFSADGAQLWTRQFGTTLLDAANYFSGGLAADGNGNVYLTAAVGPPSGSETAGDVLIAKYDGDGNLLWEQTIGTSDPEGRARIAYDGNGNIYFSGNTNGSLGGPNSGQSDAFVGKIRDTIAVTGDFNGDGIVDGADFLKWQRGESPRPNTSADLAEWKANFGAGTVESAGKAVPEPTTGCLALAGLAVSLLAAKRSARPTARRGTLKSRN